MNQKPNFMISSRFWLISLLILIVLHGWCSPPLLLGKIVTGYVKGYQNTQKNPLCISYRFYYQFETWITSCIFTRWNLLIKWYSNRPILKVSKGIVLCPFFISTIFPGSNGPYYANVITRTISKLHSYSVSNIEKRFKRRSDLIWGGKLDRARSVCIILLIVYLPK